LAGIFHLPASAAPQRLRSVMGFHKVYIDQKGLDNFHLGFFIDDPKLGIGS
jgi:hypothetical protein